MVVKITFLLPYLIRLEDEARSARWLAKEKSALEVTSEGAAMNLSSASLRLEA